MRWTSSLEKKTSQDFPTSGKCSDPITDLFERFLDFGKCLSNFENVVDPTGNVRGPWIYDPILQKVKLGFCGSAQFFRIELPTLRKGFTQPDSYWAVAVQGTGWNTLGRAHLSQEPHLEQRSIDSYCAFELSIQVCQSPSIKQRSSNMLDLSYDLTPPRTTCESEDLRPSQGLHKESKK